MAEKYVSVSALREMLSIPPDGDCEKCKHHRWNGCYNDELVRACEAIDDAPEADVVEVVRCKDCKHYREGELLGPTKFCYFWQIGTGLNTADDDFCSKGERRADNE